MQGRFRATRDLGRWCPRAPPGFRGGLAHLPTGNHGASSRVASLFRATRTRPRQKNIPFKISSAFKYSPPSFYMVFPSKPTSQKPRSTMREPLCMINKFANNTTICHNCNEKVKNIQPRKRYENYTLNPIFALLQILKNNKHSMIIGVLYLIITLVGIRKILLHILLIYQIY